MVNYWKKWKEYKQLDSCLRELKKFKEINSTTKMIIDQFGKNRIIKGIFDENLNKKQLKIKDHLFKQLALANEAYINRLNKEKNG